MPDSRSSSSTDCDSSADYPQLNEDLSMPGSQKNMATVLVTGFGPFSSYVDNPSWQAVKALKNIGVAYNIKLVCLEIPVCYESVQNKIPELWQEYQPDIVVHVGVSGLADEVTIESCAHNDGYKNLDVDGKLPVSQCYRKDGTECLQTRLDIQQICKDVNSSNCLPMVIPSTDAGRYLCEYIYYASLSEDNSKVVFVHVPPLDKPYSCQELAECLRAVIVAMMKQLDLHRPLPLPGPDLLEQLRDAAIANDVAT